MVIKKLGDLEIEAGAAQKIKKSKFKLACQLLLLCLIIAAAIGLTGGKWFGNNSLVSADGSVKIAYSQIGRIEVPQELEITVHPTINESKISIWFDSHYLRNNYIKQILPSPVESFISEDKIIYTFAIKPSNHAITISFQLEPLARGFNTAKFGIVGHQNIFFKQFIYP